MLTGYLKTSFVDFFHVSICSCFRVRTHHPTHRTTEPPNTQQPSKPRHPDPTPDPSPHPKAERGDRRRGGEEGVDSTGKGGGGELLAQEVERVNAKLEGGGRRQRRSEGNHHPMERRRRSEQTSVNFVFRGPPYISLQRLPSNCISGFLLVGVQRVLRTTQLHGRVTHVASVMQCKLTPRHSTPDASCTAEYFIISYVAPSPAPARSLLVPACVTFLFKSRVCVSVCLSLCVLLCLCVCLQTLMLRDSMCRP